MAEKPDYGDLRPVPIPQKSKVTVTFLKFPRAGVHDCWICCKFSRWLETENLNLFKAWRKRSLKVEFATFGRIGFVAPPKGNVVLPFFMEVFPSSQGSDDCVCAIELNFISAHGRVLPFSNRMSIKVESL